MLEKKGRNGRRTINDIKLQIEEMQSSVNSMFESLEMRLDQVQDNFNEQNIKGHKRIYESTDELRRLSYNLDSGMIVYLGLEKSLEDLCESISHRGKIDCQLSTNNMEDGLPLRFEIELYRMLEMYINNTIKHTDVNQIRIQLSRFETEFSLIIEDNGKGAYQEEVLISDRMGLVNFKNCTEKLGASFYLDSKMGKGTISIVEIPLN